MNGNTDARMLRDVNLFKNYVGADFPERRAAIDRLLKAPPHQIPDESVRKALSYQTSRSRNRLKDLVHTIFAGDSPRPIQFFSEMGVTGLPGVLRGMRNRTYLGGLPEALLNNFLLNYKLNRSIHNGLRGLPYGNMIARTMLGYTGGYLTGKGIEKLRNAFSSATKQEAKGVKKLVDAVKNFISRHR